MFLLLGNFSQSIQMCQLAAKAHVSLCQALSAALPTAGGFSILWASASMCLLRAAFPHPQAQTGSFLLSALPWGSALSPSIAHCTF